MPRIYHHTKPLDFLTKIVQFVLSVGKANEKMKKAILKDSYPKTAAKIPKSFHKKYKLQSTKIQERDVWTISKKCTGADTLILFLHGGAYYANMIPQHWQFIEQLLLRINATILIPDYLLAPEFSCLDNYSFLDEVYAKCIPEFHAKRIVFMGDSAGGGLALGYAQKIRNENVKSPDEIILLSPWLDVSMSHPDIYGLAEKDKLLNLHALRLAGKSYARELDLSDFRVSPINGDFSGLGRISLFISTHEMLYPDVLACRQKLENSGLDFNYFEYPGLIHDWIIITRLKESIHALEKIAELINDGKFE